jgi:hypothetical protein
MASCDRQLFQNFRCALPFVLVHAQRSHERGNLARVPGFIPVFRKRAGSKAAPGLPALLKGQPHLGKHNCPAEALLANQVAE